MPRASAGALALLLLATAAVCTPGGDSQPPELAAFDSAGVTITPVALVEPPVALEPGRCRASIGLVDGPDPYMLFGVGGATVTGGRKIAIANSGTHEIRLYDLDGRYLSTMGRKGEGPGEFEALSWVRARGDTVYAFDPSRRTLTLFTEQGFARSYALEGDWIWNAPILGPLADGSLIEIREGFERTQGADSIPAGTVRRRRIPYVRYDATGALVDTVGVFPGAETYRSVVEGGGQTLSLEIGPPFARRTYATAFGDSAFMVGDNQALDLRVFSLDGRLLRVLRGVGEPVRATSRDVASYIEASLEAGNPRLREVRAEAFEHAPARETRPAHAALVGASDGSIWLRAYDLPGARSATWYVIGRDGAVRRAFEIPATFDLLHASDAFILLRLHDSNEVESVLLCPLD